MRLSDFLGKTISQNSKQVMKKTIRSILSVLLGSTCIIANAQNQPYLSIAKDSPTTIQLNWTNQVGTTYRVLSTPDLTVPLSLWTPLEDAFSGDATVSVGSSTANVSAGFFDVEIPTNSGVQIFSPTNEQTISGIITVGVGAQIGTQIQGVNLYLDDAQIGFIDSGGIAFNLDTTHFTSGLHTLYASAVNTGNGTTTSDPITVDFENPVRWLDADSLFQSFVPIDVVSDIFPADWEIFVEDTNGVTVRTISGSTTDGNINTVWDGTDDNGNDVAYQTSYIITVAVASGGFGNSSMMMSSSSGASSSLSASASPNKYGVMEYTVDEPAPDLTAAYSALLESYSNASASEKILYPPLPSIPTDAPAVVTKQLSPLDMFVAQHQTQTATFSSGSSRMPPMGAGLGSGSIGSTSASLWREAAWNSGEIVIARQKLTGFNGIIFDGTAANLCNNVKNLVALAQDSIDNGSRRGVYNNSVMTMQHNGDFTAVKTGLASSNPDTREFYFWGHGSPNGNAIGFKEGTPNDGIRVSDLTNSLGNYYLPATGGNAALFATTKPFDFVFLDGCMTGAGSFPEAFGIPKTVAGSTYDDNHKHKRAFMGWGGPVSYSILDTETMNWSLSFWNAWLSNPTVETLVNAQNAAFSAHPSGGDGAPMETYGNNSLLWND